VLASFIGAAAGRGWRVVVTAASERHVEAYRALGLRALHIGDEAVVDPRRFSLEGRAIRKVRQAVHRVERRGWSVAVMEATALSAADCDQVDALERAWRAAQPRLYGFAMTLGRVSGAPEDDRSVYALARGPDGRLGAFLRFVPYSGGLSLDTMRRDGDELPNGLNEALVVASIEHARGQGLVEVSLNFAGFAHVMAADAVLTRRHRLLRFALRRLHGRFQFERLVLFNQRFNPCWRARYLVYGGPTQLLPSALRVLQAESYVRPPRSMPLTPRWAPAPRGIGEPLALARRGAPQ
jgi:lysyl-tRNA synthetase class 2